MITLESIYDKTRVNIPYDMIKQATHLEVLVENLEDNEEDDDDLEDNNLILPLGIKKEYLQVIAKFMNYYHEHPELIKMKTIEEKNNPDLFDYKLKNSYHPDNYLNPFDLELFKNFHCYHKTSKFYGSNEGIITENGEELLSLFALKDYSYYLMYEHLNQAVSFMIEKLTFNLSPIEFTKKLSLNLEEEFKLTNKKTYTNENIITYMSDEIDKLISSKK